MSIKDDVDKLSPEEIQKRWKEKFRKNASKDPKAREAAKDFVEMNAAAYESSKMSEGEGFTRGFLNMIIGTFGKGERAQRAKSRGMGFLTNHMFNQATAKLDGEPEKKLEVSPEEMTKAFNGEMERVGAPLVAQEDGDEIKVSTWDADEEDEQ